MSQQADQFIEQIEKNTTPATHLIHDRDSKFEGNFGAKIKGKGIKVIRLLRRSPDMNAYAERAIRSMKHGCLNHFVILGEKHLNYLIQEYVKYYNNERPHSSREFLPPCRDGPSPPLNSKTDGILCDERLGGLFKHYFITEMQPDEVRLDGVNHLIGVFRVRRIHRQAEFTLRDIVLSRQSFSITPRSTFSPASIKKVKFCYPLRVMHINAWLLTVYHRVDVMFKHCNGGIRIKRRS